MDKLTQLERRLALAEQDVRATRAQVEELQQEAQLRKLRGPSDGKDHGRRRAW